jgi:hypothetical protein
MCIFDKAQEVRAVQNERAVATELGGGARLTVDRHGAAQEVFRLLETDSFPRFKQSSRFQGFVAAISEARRPRARAPPSPSP